MSSIWALHPLSPPPALKNCAFPTNTWCDITKNLHLIFLGIFFTIFTREILDLWPWDIWWELQGDMIKPTKRQCQQQRQWQRQDLWHLRHWLQIWQLRTWTDNWLNIWLSRKAKQSTIKYVLNIFTFWKVTSFNTHTHLGKAFQN